MHALTPKIILYIIVAIIFYFNFWSGEEGDLSVFLKHKKKRNMYIEIAVERSVYIV
jgi:hypothetical protein